MKKLLFFFLAFFLINIFISGCNKSTTPKEDGDAREQEEVNPDMVETNVEVTENVEGVEIEDMAEVEEHPDLIPIDNISEEQVEPCTEPGMKMCGDVCVNTNTDVNNCGDCGIVCSPPNIFCVDGQCTDQCPGTLVNCDGECVDTTSDPHNCGDCGNECATGGICTEGICGCPGSLVFCMEDNICTDVSTDPEHCGSCDSECPAGANCVSGNCICPSGTTNCGDVCANLQTDPTHCGDCRTNCGRLGTCVDGECGDCQTGATDCFGICVDLNTDPNNCGSCFNRCSDSQMCVDGQCECRPGLTYCPGGMGGGCYNLNTSSRHCGDCNTACGNGQYCYNGTCVNQRCENQTPPAVSCPTGFGGTSCVFEADFQTDPQHCGDCATRCTRSQICVAGDCENYIVGSGCTSCPCSFCLPSEACCLYPGTTDYVICVAGGTCP